MKVTTPYETIGFGAMAATRLYEFIGFGAMDATKPPVNLRVLGLRWLPWPQSPYMHRVWWLTPQGHRTHQYIGLGDLRCAKAHKFLRVGGFNGHKAHKFKRLGDLHGSTPTNLHGLGALMAPKHINS